MTNFWFFKPQIFKHKILENKTGLNINIFTTIFFEIMSV